MTVIDAHDALASRTCRVGGCAEEVSSKASVGRFANLCSRHYEAERQKMSAAQTGTTAGSYEQRAKHLVTAGRKLDQAIKLHKQSRASLDAALADWDEAKRVLTSAVREAE